MYLYIIDGKAYYASSVQDALIQASATTVAQN